MTVEAWSRAYRSGDVLWIGDFETYDAGTVSPSTATSGLYPAAGFARRTVREPGPPVPPPSRACSTAAAAIRAATTAGGPRRPTSAGSAGTSSSTASATRRDGRAEVTRVPHRPRRRAARSRASTQNQALCALLFLYRDVLGRELPWLDDVVRAKRPAAPARRPHPRRGPAVLDGSTAPRGYGLAPLRRRPAPARSAAGCASRTSTSRRTRSLVRDGKGAKDRVTMLPGRRQRRSGRPPRARRELSTRATCRTAPAGSSCPTRSPASTRAPAANGRWQWVFPATRIYVDRATGQRRRHHLTRPTSSAPSRTAVRARRPRQARELPHLPPLASPPTCWRPATTSAPSRSSSATATSARP